MKIDWTNVHSGRVVGVLTAIMLGVPDSASAQSTDRDLAQEVVNPVSNIIQVPLEFDFDRNLGATGEGDRVTLNVKPVIPFPVGTDWMLISRTVLPIIYRDDVVPGSSQFGIGDVLQTFFLAPVPKEGDVIWGVGPAFLLATGKSELSANQSSGGLNAVALRQANGWTYGALVQHLWGMGSVGSSGRDVDLSLLQPFIVYTTPTRWSFGVTSEATYDWSDDQESIPITLTVGKLTSVFDRPISIGASARYWARSPEFGPEGWALRVTVTLILPGG